MAALLLLAVHTPSFARLDDILKGRTFGGKVIKGLAIGYAVREASQPLNRFIDTVTLRNLVPTRLATKVVPVLSVGQRAYIGGAQVIGPRSLINKTQAVWQYEQNFDNGNYRVKALVPSSSLNPLELKRVPKVGLSALIDVSLDNGYPAITRSRAITGERLLLAGGVAAGVQAVSNELNRFINTVTFNRSGATKVVPQVSFGERAYIGGVQVTGSSRDLPKVKVVWEYQDLFDKGRYRIRALVPTNGIDPRSIRRVDGVGVLALIDTSIARQERVREARYPRRFERSKRVERWDNRPRWDDDKDEEWVPPGHRKRHDNGLHRGWEIGKHKGWYKNGKKKDKDRDEDD